MKPNRCPRCERPAAEWSVDRQPGRDVGRAGCPCGELIEVAFIEEQKLAAPVAEVARAPRGWKEDALVDRWRGQLKPRELAGYVFAAVMLGIMASVVVAARGAPAATALSALVWLVLGGAAAAGTYGYRAPWTFAFESGRFRASALKSHCDVPLEEIVGFAAAPSSKQNSRVRFDLLVHRVDAATLRIPLHVEVAEEARFIVDRANALLATDGRTVEEDYRGTRVRVAVDVGGGGGAIEDALEDDVEEEERQRRRLR